MGAAPTFDRCCLEYCTPNHSPKKTPTLGLAFLCSAYSITAAFYDQSPDAGRNRPGHHGACPMARRLPTSAPGAFSARAWLGAWCWRCQPGDPSPEHHDQTRHGCCDRPLVHHHDPPDAVYVEHVRRPGEQVPTDDDRLPRAVHGKCDRQWPVRPTLGARCGQHARYEPLGATIYAAYAQACLCSWHSSAAWPQASSPLQHSECQLRTGSFRASAPSAGRS